MANLNDVLQGLVNLNSKMANNINSLLDSIGEGFLDVGVLSLNNNTLTLQGATILVNGSNIAVPNLSASFSGNKICFLEFKADKSCALKVLDVVDANFNYDLSALNSTSKYFEVARQYNGESEDRRVIGMASNDNTIVGALNGALKAIDYDNEMDLEINMDILSRVSAVESDIVDLDTKKADKTYVDEAVANVDIDGVVTAVDVSEVEDIENPYITKEELDAILGDATGISVSDTYALNANDTDNILGYYPTYDGTINLPSECYNAGDNNYSLWGILFTQIEPKYNTIVQQYIPTWGAWQNVTFTRIYNKDDGFSPWSYHLDSSEWSSELQTNNKTFIGAINELFTSANNGKELIADAIGEPLSSEDTFSAMSTKINTLTTSFKSALLNKGVAISGTDTFQSLITKIENITDGGGNSGSLVKTGEVSVSTVNKTFTLMELDSVTGEVTASETMSLPCYTITADFEPSIINATITFNLGNGYDPITFTYRYDNISNTNAKVDITGYVPLSASLLKEGDTIYLPDILSIESGEGATAPKYPIQSSSYTVIGIGENTTLRDSLASILQDAGVEVTENDDMASLIAKTDAKLDEGGASVNLTSATTLPRTGTENQICVITDNPVSNFIISPNLDDYNSNANTICALTSTSGNGLDPVLVQSNGITQYYYFDKMHQGDTFKKSYIFKNGAWQEYTQAEAILIKNKAIVTDAIFGGLAYYEGDGSTEYVKETTAGVEMYFTTTYSNYYWGMCSNKAVNFSKFTTIKITYANLNNNTDGFYVALGYEDGTTDPNEYVGFANDYYVPPTTNEWIYACSNGSSETVTVDISSWNRVGFLVIHYHNQTGAQKVRFTEITMY